MLSVFFAFPEGMSLDRKILLVHRMYDDLQFQFDNVLARIQRSLVDEERFAKLATQFAIQDAQDVATLKGNISKERTKPALKPLTRYLERHPNSAGVQFHCKLACRQAVAAAKGINVFDWGMFTLSQCLDDECEVDNSRSCGCHPELEADTIKNRWQASVFESHILRRAIPCCFFRGFKIQGAIKGPIRCPKGY